MYSTMSMVNNTVLNLEICQENRFQYSRHLFKMVIRWEDMLIS